MRRMWTKIWAKMDALRHTRLIHGAASDIISNDIKLRSSYMSHNKYHNYKKNSRFSIKPVYRYIMNTMITIRKYLIWQRRFKKIIKIIDQLIKPFNKLEEFLIGYNPNTRAFILSRSFDVSMQSHNPVGAMNEMVELLHSINGIKKIAMYNSINASTTSLDPIFGIKEKIKDSYLFGR